MEAARLNIFDPKQNVLDENADHGDQSLKMEDQHAASHRLSMAQLQTMEFKQAFEEFDKVIKLTGVILTQIKRSFAIIRPSKLFEGSKWDNINERAPASHEVDGAKPDRGRGGFSFSRSFFILSWNGQVMMWLVENRNCP